MCRGFSLTKPGVEMLLDLLHPEKSRLQHLQSVFCIGFTSEPSREGIRGGRQRLQWDPLWSTGESQRLGMECPNSQETLRLEKRLSSMKSCYFGFWQQFHAADHSPGASFVPKISVQQWDASSQRLSKTSSEIFLGNVLNWWLLK